jgi:hypothetical protein
MLPKAFLLDLDSSPLAGWRQQPKTLQAVHSAMPKRKFSVPENGICRCRGNSSEIMY